MPTPFVLRNATLSDLDQVRELFREYQSWLGVDLCFQSFEAELAGLPGRYAPPSGRLIVAETDGRLAGAIGLRAIDGEGVCEMKRLYVRDWAKGRGIGRALMDRVLAEAREAGYRVMRLDTLPSQMPAANAMYDRAGFREIPAYYDNPVANVRFLELAL